MNPKVILCLLIKTVSSSLIKISHIKPTHVQCCYFILLGHIHSCSNDEKEIETGVEVVEENFRGSEPLVHENYMDISGRMLPLPILPDSIRLSNHKTVAASIAAAQAALTCTLSPSLRKKSSIASSMGENTTVENIVYTCFSEEIEQIKRISNRTSTQFFVAN